MNNKTDTTNWHIDWADQESVDEINPWIIFAVVIVGTIGNCLVCFAVLLNRTLQNVRNYYLLSLAVTDLLVSLLVLPTRMITVRYVFPPSTYPLCYLYLVGDDFITAASAIHICFISVLRYTSLKDPLQLENVTKKQVALRISMIWLLAFVSIIPYMTLAIISHQPNVPKYCSELLADFMYFETIVFVEALIIFIMIAVVFTTFILTIRLIYTLEKQKQLNSLNDKKGLVGSVEDISIEEKAPIKIFPIQEPKSTNTVTWLVSFVFIISMGPYACINLFFVIFPSIIIPPILLSITSYLAYTNSAVNPIIYLIFDEEFRRAIKNLLLLKYEKL